MTGVVWGLGVGPGDPELLTLKALRLLRAADLVVYPATAAGASLTREIVAPHLDGDREEMAIRVPMTVARFPPRAVYDRAADAIAARAAAGDDVAVLCEGDPFLYGSFMYLFARLSERAKVEVVPGVSSLTACAARLGAPLAGAERRAERDPGRPRRCRPRAPDRRRRRRRHRQGRASFRALAPGALGARPGGSRPLRGARHDGSRAHRAALEVDPTTVPYFSMVLVHKRGDAWR